MFYRLLISAHIAAIVAGLGGTRAEILALAYAIPEIIARSPRFDRLVSTPALVVVARSWS
jgi:hypothetical protein